MKLREEWHQTISSKYAWTAILVVLALVLVIAILINLGMSITRDARLVLLGFMWGMVTVHALRAGWRALIGIPGIWVLGYSLQSLSDILSGPSAMLAWLENVGLVLLMLGFFFMLFQLGGGRRKPLAH